MAIDVDPRSQRSEPLLLDAGYGPGAASWGVAIVFFAALAVIMWLIVGRMNPHADTSAPSPEAATQPAPPPADASAPKSTPAPSATPAPAPPATPAP